MDVRTETIKLIRENIGGNFLDIHDVIEFLNFTLKAKATKVKVKKLNYVKQKNTSAQERKPSTKEKTCRMEGNICMSHI